MLERKLLLLVMLIVVEQLIKQKLIFVQRERFRQEVEVDLSLL